MSSNPTPSIKSSVENEKSVLGFFFSEGASRVWRIWMLQFLPKSAFTDPSMLAIREVAGELDDLEKGVNVESVITIADLYKGTGLPLSDIESSFDEQVFRYIVAAAPDEEDRATKSAKIVRALYELRELSKNLEACILSGQACKSVKEIEVWKKSLPDRITSKVIKRTESCSIEMVELMSDCMIQVEQSEDYVKTGIIPLDNLIGGLTRPSYTIVAGRPSMGKTAFALSVGLNIAKVRGRVGIWSLEMDRYQVARRIVSMETGIPWREMKYRYGDAYDKAIELSSLPLSVFDESKTIGELLGEIEMENIRSPFQAVIVDYVELIERSRDQMNLSERDFLTLVSRKIKFFSKKVQFPVIILSQLNRDVEKRQDKRPMCSDLHGAGAFEKDADQVLFPYRPSVYEPDLPRDEAQILVSKNRNGEQGVAHVIWDGRAMKYRNGGSDGQF
jgi:replicative DNA helicase